MNINDLQVDRVSRSFVKDSGVGGANATVTATQAAVAGANHVVQRVVGTYSTTAGVGTLTVSFGATVIATVQSVGGLASIVFENDGHFNPTTNQAVSASLTGGGGALTGTVYIKGYTTSPA